LERKKDSYSLRFSKALYSRESVEKGSLENKVLSRVLSRDKNYRVVKIKSKEKIRALELANCVFAFNRTLRRKDEN